jgi:Methyltransferase domain
MAGRAQKIFSWIYSKNIWGNSESRSGNGSTVSRTILLRHKLAELAQEQGIRSLLDIPCGDFNWMRLTELTGIEYTGADIVPQLVEKNAALYGQPGRRFIHLNMCRDPLPRADLILCREGWVHLSFSDIAMCLRQMKQSQSTYLLTTTFTAHSRNREIATGDWRPLNLSLAPFCFPAPLCTLPDGPLPDGTYPDKALAMYRLADLPEIKAGFNLTAVLQWCRSRTSLARLKI